MPHSNVTNVANMANVVNLVNVNYVLGIKDGALDIGKGY